MILAFSISLGYVDLLSLLYPRRAINSDNVLNEKFIVQAADGLLDARRRYIGLRTKITQMEHRRRCQPAAKVSQQNGSRRHPNAAVSSTMPKSDARCTGRSRGVLVQYYRHLDNAKHDIYRRSTELGIIAQSHGLSPKLFDTLQADPLAASAEEINLAIDMLRSISATEPHPADPPPLPPRQQAILRTLWHFGALSPESLRSRQSIAARIDESVLFKFSVDGKQQRHDVGKQSIQSLAKRGLVQTRSGRGGGAWLTPEGQRLAEELVKRERRSRSCL
ncbi:MAG: hypothetical protein ACM359_14005 [Bacillota bacterium]